MGKHIVDLDLPDEVLVILVSRNNSFVVPRGATVLESNDRMLVLADELSLAKVQAIVEDGAP